MENSGKKNDQGKIQWGLFPWLAAKEVTKVMMYGANKYGKYNWVKGLKYSRAWDATLRHLTAWWAGEENDSETGISHLAHAGCEILFLLTYRLTNLSNLDDRPGANKAFTKDDSCICPLCRHEFEQGGENNGSPVYY